jgi:hypothetical protein
MGFMHGATEVKADTRCAEFTIIVSYCCRSFIVLILICDTLLSHRWHVFRILSKRTMECNTGSEEDISPHYSIKQYLDRNKI